MTSSKDDGMACSRAVSEQDQAKIADAHAIARRASDRLAHLTSYKGCTASNSIEFDIMHRLLHSLADVLAMLDASQEDLAADPVLVQKFKDADAVLTSTDALIERHSGRDAT